MVSRILDAIASQSLEQADVLGPNPCLLARLRGKYRYDLLVRTANASAMRQLMGHLEQSHTLRAKVESLFIDVDPVALS